MSTGAHTRRLEVAIVLTSMAMLMFEILQTITMSLQAMEKNAFLVISLCLMGLGGGGSLATVMSRRRLLPLDGVLWWSALGFGITMIVTMMASSWMLSLLPLVLLGVAPYIFVGVFLSFAFKTHSASASRLYFLNLMGSGMGCLGLMWVINGTGDVAITLFLVASLSLAAAAVLARSRRRRVVPLAAVAILVVLLPFRGELFGFRPAADKGMGLIIDDQRIESEITWSRWGYLGRLDVVNPGKGIKHFPMGGRGIAKLMERGLDVRFLFASGGNWTKAVHFHGKKRAPATFTRGSRHSLAYILTRNPEVLNIGFGGGVDIFLALRNNARSVVGVDINPLMIRAGREHLVGYFEDFYNDPRVTIKMMDGRAYVRNTDRKFDVVSLTAVDTGELLHQNAHVLLENYLYTQEAFHDYISVLKDDGFVYVSRPNAQLMRAIVTAVASLRELGVEDVERHFAVIRAGTNPRGDWQSVLISKKPLGEAQTHRIVKRYEERILYLPRHAGNDEDYEAYFRAVARGTDDRYLAKLEEDFAPVHDDRPFFYEFARTMKESAAVAILVNVLEWVSAIAAVLILLPIAAMGVRAVGGAARMITTIGYFSSIGAGFMFIEICLIQKLVLFLGHPSYSVTVTLFSILVFSGLGSLFSQRFDVWQKRTGLIIWLPILAGTLFYTSLLGPILEQVPSALPLRVVVTALLLAPVSFFMGMPFPTMIRILGEVDTQMIPWAWAVNAFTSVAASVVSVLVAIEAGFSTVFELGGVFYLLALVFFVLQTLRRPQRVQP